MMRSRRGDGDWFAVAGIAMPTAAFCIALHGVTPSRDSQLICEILNRLLKKFVESGPSELTGFVFHQDNGFSGSWPSCVI